jgi:polysaccharide export outer membrane protein
VEIPPGYVIGPEDFLAVVFWQEKDLSTEVVVRPDGKISLPLLNDVQAAGHTPEQLAAIVSKAASKFVTEPLATVIVKQINSRKVFVLGAVGKPGPVNLTTDMTVLQLLSLVGGLQEYAKRKDITVVRRENGQERRYKFNYDEVMAGKKTAQNIKLEPGDTVLVFD